MLQLVLNKAINVWLIVLVLFVSNINAAENIGGVIEQSGSIGQINRTTGENLPAKLDTDIVSMD